MKNFEIDFDFLEKREINIKLLVVSFLIVAMAIYMGFLIYGNRGLNQLIDLQNNTLILKKEVNKLKKENINLQKEFFGLKDIEDSK